MKRDPLPSWADTATRATVTSYVQDTASRVPAEARVAVFDNDGTLWPEKPLPVQLGYILRHLAEAAGNDPALRDRQPWQAAYTGDHQWLGHLVERHYHGDDTDVQTLIAGLTESFAGMDVEQYEAQAAQFVQSATHPTLGRPYASCAYRPMIELLRYLEANEFACYIASGGDRDFVRPIAQTIYGIPPERVIGSTFGLQYTERADGGSLLYKASLDVFDDGPQKPVRIWSRIGRRPILACGNSNGDLPMLGFTDGLRLIVGHDDAERESAYTAGAEDLLARARKDNWTVISMRDDWATVFTDTHGPG